MTALWWPDRRDWRLCVARGRRRGVQLGPLDLYRWRPTPTFTPPDVRYARRVHVATRLLAMCFVAGVLLLLTVWRTA